MLYRLIALVALVASTEAFVAPASAVVCAPPCALLSRPCSAAARSRPRRRRRPPRARRPPRRLSRRLLPSRRRRRLPLRPGGAPRGAAASFPTASAPCRPSRARRTASRTASSAPPRRACTLKQTRGRSPLACCTPRLPPLFNVSQGDIAYSTAFPQSIY